MKLPNRIFGIETKDAYQKYLKGDIPKQPEPETRAITPSNVPNPEQYIIMEGKIHGSYSYPDLLVTTDKKHFNHNWQDAGESLKQEGLFMLTIRQYVDFLNLLRTGKVHDGKGNLIGSDKIKTIYDSITKQENPWKAEWLDAKFGKNEITYHALKNNRIEEITEPLENCLMKDKIPGIDLEYWLKNATNQGLPQRNTPKGALYYWSPVADRVAWFRAISGRVILNCDGDPRDSDSALGVRGAKIKV